MKSIAAPTIEEMFAVTQQTQHSLWRRCGLVVLFNTADNVSSPQNPESDFEAGIKGISVAMQKPIIKQGAEATSNS